MGLLDLLQQVVGAGSEAHFDKVVQNASMDQLGAGLAAALRSDQTPAFGQMIGNLFEKSNASQQAGVLNEILAALGPAALSSVAGGVLGRMLAPGQTQLTPEEASQLTPGQVNEIATHAEHAHPGIVDQVSQFYAQHSGLVKTLGGAVLALALAKMKENATSR